MAISFVGSLPTVAAANGGNVTLTFSNLRDAANVQPTLVQNDVVFAIFAWGNTADYVAPTISGWTLLDDKYANGSTNDTNLAVYYKRMGAVPDTAITATGPGGSANSSVGVAFALRGVDITTVIDTYVSGTHSTTGTGTGAINPLAITPASAGAWIAVVGALANPAGATLTNGGDLSATTNHFRTGTSPDTTDISVGVGLKTDWASGAFDPAAWSGGGARAAGDSWAAITFSIKAQAAASHVGESSLTATGSMTAAGTKSSEGAASLTAVGSLAAEGTVSVPGITYQGAADLTATGSLTAGALATRHGAATLAGGGSVAAGGLVSKVGASALSAAGSLSAVPALFTNGASALVASGSLAGQGLLTSVGAVALIATGSLSANGIAIRTGASALSSAVSLEAAGTTTIGGSTYQGAASPEGAGSLTASGTVDKVGGAALASSGSLSADGFVPQVGSAILTGVSGLAAQALLEMNAEAALAATATFLAHGTTAQDTETPEARTTYASPPARDYSITDRAPGTIAPSLPRTTYAARRTA
jgi:hypothetical protein